MAERAKWLHVTEGAWDLLNAQIARAVDLLARPQRSRVRKVSAATAVLTEADDVVLVDSTGAAVTLSTLTPAAQFLGHEIAIKRTTGANAVTFDPKGSETIDGSATASVVNARITSDGTNWVSIP